MKKTLKKLILLMMVLTFMFSLNLTVNAASQKQKALKAYANFMASQGSNVRFAIVYIDNDSVPELIRDCNGSYGLRVYTYKNNKVTGLYSNWDRNGYSETTAFAYYPKKSLFRIRSGLMFDCYDYYTLKNGQETVVLGYNQIGEYYRFNKNTFDHYISKKEFQKRLKKLVGNKKLTTCTYYKNTSANRKKILGYAGSVPASIKLNKSSSSVYVGKSIKLKATVKGKSSKVTWSSSNKKIATVSSSGKVTGKKTGKVTIYAKANGKTAKCTVTIKKLTKNQIIEAMEKYYPHKSSYYCSWILYEGKSGDKYNFYYRSYTGAHGKYYVYASTGKIYEQYRNPITNEWESIHYSGSIYNYL